MIYLVLPLFIGAFEIILILGIVYLVFGSAKLPEIARNLGKGMRTLREATNDIKREVTNSTKVQDQIETGVTKDIKEELNKVKDDLEDFTGSVKRTL